MKDPQAAIDTLQQLRDLGVHLAIDDFGTGYLPGLPETAAGRRAENRPLFVKDIETDRNDAAICASILALAKSLGLKVVAEGVETAAQRDFLDSHGCDYLQGYFFAKPQPAALCAEQWRQAPAPARPGQPIAASPRPNTSAHQAVNSRRVADRVEVGSVRKCSSDGKVPWVWQERSQWMARGDVGGGGGKRGDAGQIVGSAQVEASAC